MQTKIIDRLFSKTLVITCMHGNIYVVCTDRLLMSMMLAAPTDHLVVILRPHLLVKLRNELLGLGIDHVVPTVRIIGTALIVLVVIGVPLGELL